MARPTPTTISQGLEGWDAFLNTNFANTFTKPFPIHENASLTEATLAATFPAASYDRCLVWVNHTSYGYLLYQSNGTDWLPYAQAERSLSRTVTGSATLTSAETSSLILAGGSLPYTINLPAASTMRGRRLSFKTLVSGTLTIDASGAETIDGALTATITTQYGVLRLYCDGTSWHVV